MILDVFVFVVWSVFVRCCCGVWCVVLCLVCFGECEGGVGGGGGMYYCGCGGCWWWGVGF